MNAGSERLEAAFANSGKRAALMPYVMAGFPDIETSLRIGEACVEAGADVLEVGVPFSDPLADGPVIHAAATSALAAGVTVAGALEVSSKLAERVPVVLMCYANPILLRGVQEFAQALARMGISGLIVPDLPFEEGAEMLAACDASGVAYVSLVAPTTTDQRMASIGANGRGFLYTVSLTGTTGERSAISSGLGLLVQRARAHTSVPVAVGFGISNGEQAQAVAAAGADGVIIASRLVREAGQSDDPPAAVGALVAELARALAQ